MLILLTNDDGIDSEGLVLLKDRLSKQHEVCTIAPERERTCIGHAVTIHKPLRIKEVGKGLFSTNGTPADCVLLGIRVLLRKKPDLIISGINKGPNMGQDVNYSGTVAAAKEGAFLGISSMAISIGARADYLFNDAIAVINEIIEKSRNVTFPDQTFLIINIPNIPQRNIKGFMVTRLGKRIYNDAVIERVDPRGGKYYWIGGNGVSFESIEGTDFYAIEKGYTSITPLGLDITSNNSIDIFKRYFRSISG
ncbi:MAG: 5'/3'-nucleotidase SurE [Deltaproteobacteria bacterium]